MSELRELFRVGLLMSVVWTACPTPGKAEPPPADLQQHADSSKHRAGQLVRQKRFAEAVGFYERAVAGYEQLYRQESHPEGHPGLADTLNLLGVALQRNQEYERARKCFERTLAMNEQLYPKEKYPAGHAAIAVSLHNLGFVVLNELKQHQQAREYLERSLAMYEQLYPKDKYPLGPPNIANKFDTMARILRNLGEQQKAEEFFERARAGKPSTRSSPSAPRASAVSRRSAVSALEKSLKTQNQAVGAAAAEALANVRWEKHPACQPAGIPATLVKEGDQLLLNVAPRDHAPERPPEGWCGEVAVQEALLYHGAFFPQKAINRAGNPRHPDLYSNEIPVALKNLGVDFEEWPRRQARPSVDSFIGWIRGWHAKGSPVLVGVKIYPTKHEEWFLDHFVLAVGHTRDTLWLNTTWGYRLSRTDQQLGLTYDGFAFENRYHDYYGLAIKGLGGSVPRPFPIRLFALTESDHSLLVAVKCEALQPGHAYAVYRSASPQPEAKPLVEFRAERGVYAFYDRIDKAHPAVYQCRSAPAETSSP